MMAMAMVDTAMGSAKMSVLGDNVANVNTVAFKSSRSTFQDVLAQSVSTAAGSAQVGDGPDAIAVGVGFCKTANAVFERIFSGGNRSP